MKNKIVLVIESAFFKQGDNIGIKDTKGNLYEVKEYNKLFSDHGTKQNFVRLLTNAEQTIVEDLYLPF